MSKSKAKPTDCQEPRETPGELILGSLPARRAVELTSEGVDPSPAHPVGSLPRQPDASSRPARITAATVRFDAILALVAGFLDAYTYLKRGNVFATAQTGNVVLLALNLAQHHVALATRKLAPLGAFAVGVILAETIRRPSVAGRLRRPLRVVLLIEAIVLVVVRALPASAPDAVATILVAFVTSVQLTTFRTLVDWPVSTAMTTGNMRSAFTAAFAAVVDRDRAKAKEAKSYATVVIGFFAGAVLGGLLSVEVGLRAVWIAAAILLGALALFVVDERPQPGQMPPTELPGHLT